jgi:hypothetical protein
MRALVIAALVASLGGIAHADDKQLAAEHFDAATKAYVAGSDAEALGDHARSVEQYRVAVSEYEASYKVARQPSTLYWLGQAHRALGELELALAAYRSYLLQAPPKGKFRDDASVQIRRLEEAIEQRRAAQQAPPRGVPSNSEESARADIAPPAAPVVAAPRALAPAVIAVPAETRRPWYKSAVGWSLAGGGLALGIVGAALFAPAASADDDARHALSVQAQVDAQNRATNYRTAAYSLLGVGGAAVIAGVVVFAVGGRSTRSKQVQLAPTSGGLVLTFGGSL